jgi:hypothetical protein
MRKIKAVVITLAALSAALSLLYVTAAAAASSGTITVCPAGPPACEYATIQEGVDAAGAGDTVLVGTGVYTEQVTLKSDVTVSSTHGALSSTVTYPYGPIISATNVLSVRLQGIGVRGQAEMSPAVGIDLLDSETVISGSVVVELRAEQGQEAHGIRADGGILVVAGVTIQHMQGGIGDSVESYSDCGYFGGAAIGIRASDVDLVVKDCEFSDLRGGEGCVADGHCGGQPLNAGDAIGVWGTGGSVVLSSSLFTGFDVQSGSGRKAEACAVRTSGTSATRLGGNEVVRLGLDPPPPHLAGAPKSPCYPTRGKLAVGVSSTSDGVLDLAGNSIADLMGGGVSGYAAGIAVVGTGPVTIADNTISRIVGGYETTSFGILVERSDVTRISANAISGVSGAQAQPSIFSIPSGDVAGIELAEVTQAAIVNNVVWSLRGGDGQEIPPISPWGRRRGGHAYALSVSDTTARVQNNTFYQTVAGIGDEIIVDGSVFRGEDGRSAGLYLASGADVLAINNAVITHSIGIWSTSSYAPILGYNDLWDNILDYNGVLPGAGDLHVAPAFIDPENGDFHLWPFSPLVDAGTNLFLLEGDFEGDPRPLDGDGDSVSRADIAADEYLPWVHSYVFPIVARSAP